MSSRAFTLIEMLIVISIVIVLLATVFVSVNTTTKRQTLDKSTAIVVAVLNEARSLTVSAKAGSTYGVHLASTGITLFTGSVYNAGSTSNRVLVLDTRVALTNITLAGGGSDIVFDKMTGTTSQNGTFRISYTSDATQYRTIIIYSTGVIEVQ